jgi:hypothetical protein
MPSNNDALQRIAAEFNAEMNAAYGLYLDATSGFSALVDLITKLQQESGATDDTPFFYGSGEPGHPENVLLHQTTQGILKARIQKGGGNYFILARLLIVLLYELWETAYRTRLATAADIPRDKLTVPIFGDLRLLRHAILHNKGCLGPRAAGQLEVLTPSTAGSVDYNNTDIERVIRLIKTTLDELVTRWTGEDPGYRRIWRVA